VTPIVRLDRVHARTGCIKPGCGREPTVRHHKRSERQWIRSWAATRRLQARYRAFVRQYMRFDPADTVLLCHDHHEEIHEHYYIQTGLYLQRHPSLRKPLHRWTWTEAEALMSRLSAFCDEWLQTPSPGSTNRRFTTQQSNYPSLRPYERSQ
jgi:hypothetical protein